MARSLAGTRWAAVSVTDNGRTPAEIVEVGIVHVDEGVIARGPRLWLVRPQRLPTRRTNRLRGLRRDDLLRAPAWGEVSRQVREALAGRFVVAHHAARVYPLLRTQLPGWEPPAVFDVARLARRVWPRLPSYHLDLLTVHARLRPTSAGQHSTGHEVHAVALVLLELARVVDAREAAVARPTETLSRRPSQVMDDVRLLNRVLVGLKRL